MTPCFVYKIFQKRDHMARNTFSVSPVVHFIFTVGFFFKARINMVSFLKDNSVFFFGT